MVQSNSSRKKQEEDNKIIINKDYIDTFKSKFKDLKEKTK